MKELVELVSQAAYYLAGFLERLGSAVWNAPLLWLFLGIVALVLIVGTSRRTLH